MKPCPTCKTLCFDDATTCYGCGYEFPIPSDKLAVVNGKTIVSKPDTVFDEPKAGWTQLTLGGVERRVSAAVEPMIEPILEKTIESVRKQRPLIHRFDQERSTFLLIVETDETHIIDDSNKPLATRIDNFGIIDWAFSLLNTVKANTEDWCEFEGYAVSDEDTDDERATYERHFRYIDHLVGRLNYALARNADPNAFYEDKTGFTDDLNEALILCGNHRYDYLEREPLRYEKQDGREYVFQGDNNAVSVNMDSLTAMMKDISRLFD